MMRPDTVCPAWKLILEVDGRGRPLVYAVRYPGRWAPTTVTASTAASMPLAGSPAAPATVSVSDEPAGTAAAGRPGAGLRVSNKRGPDTGL